MRQPRDWYTSVQDNTLRKMKRMGFSAAEIADKLDRTEGSVRERASILGMPWQKEAGTSVLASRSQVDLGAERMAEIRHRQSDSRFVRLLALAIQRGDHLPAGTPIPLQLIG